MMRVVRIVLIAVAAAILFVVAAGTVLLATMDDADYRRLASYLVERATGRTLVVDGRFAVHLSLRPALVMSKARVTNPPWASGPNLAEIGHMEVQVALRPLLSRTLLIERLILEDATFALERSADGAASWTTGSGGRDLGLVPVLGTVRLRNVDWRYRDDATGSATAVQLAHLTIEDAGGAGRLDAQGVWDGQPVAAKGTLGTLAEAVHPTSSFPLDLAVALPGLDLGVRGTIAEPAAGRGLDLRLVGHSDDIAPFLQLLGHDAPLAGRAEGEATLRGDFDASRIADLRLSVGKGSGGQPPELEVKGAIATVRPGAAPLLEGIALEIEGSTATAALATWIGRPLPDLGPITGQLMLSGTSEALQVSEIKLQAGAKGGPTLGATGDIEQIQLDPALAVRGADLRLEAAAPDLAAVGTMLDVSLPRGPFSYTGRLSGDPDQWALAGQVRLGDTAVSQTFTGSVAGAPPRLSGELSAAFAGLELSARGTVADPAKGQGLDLDLVGHADDVAQLLGLLGRQAPPGGRLEGQATISGDLEALRVADLQLSLDQGPGAGGQPALQATGQIARVTPNGGTLLDGIALQIQGATSTAVLSGWLGRPLPDLGPVQGQLTLSGSSNAVKVTGMKLQAGTAEGLSLAATGGIDEIRLTPDLAVRGADLQLDAKAPDLSSIGAMLATSVPATSPWSYTGRLSGDPAAWALAGKAQVGKTEIEGDLTASFQGARPRLAGKLSVPVLHVADFVVASPQAGHAHGPPKPAASSGAWPSMSALQAVDLDVSVDIGQVEGTELAIGQGEVALTLEDGVLRIDPARFDFVAGTMLIHATADSRREPPQIDLSLHADDVQLGELLRAMGRSAPFTGELALILKLQSLGDSREQLVSSLGGEAQFALQRGGVDLGSLNLGTADVLTWLLAGTERGTGLLRGITASGRTTLECFAGRFVIADGIATAQSLLMKTPLTISTATGTLNLVDQTIDLQAHLGARRASMFDPAQIYRIHGPLADPAVDFSRTGFAARAIAGLALKPLDVLGSLLQPLVSDGGKDRVNPCLSAAS
ncbi:MAG: AsmA family protein [Geminicoccaceae bacterium]